MQKKRDLKDLWSFVASDEAGSIYGVWNVVKHPKIGKGPKIGF